MGLNGILEYFGFSVNKEIKQELEDAKGKLEIAENSLTEFLSYGDNLEKERDGLKVKAGDLQDERNGLKIEVGNLQERLREAENDVIEVGDCFDEIFESYDLAKKEINRLGIRIVDDGNLVSTFSDLSKPEKIYLLSYVPKKTSSVSVEKKYRIPKHTENKHPRKFKSFLEKVAGCEYISWIDIKFINRGAKKTFFDRIYSKDETVIIEGVCVSNGRLASLKVSTTARNDKEAKYIRNLLNNIKV